MNTFKKLLYILSWLPVGALNLALLLIGIPIVACLARKPMSRWPRWTWLWQNDGDAVDWDLGAMRPPHDVPRWFFEKFYDGKPWIRIRLGENMGGYNPHALLVLKRHSQKTRRFMYMALRNPVNNHRFIFDDVIFWKTSGDPEAFDTEGYHLARQGILVASGWRYTGWLAGYRYIWLNKGPNKYSEFYIGCKVGSKVPGLGFTFQLRLNRDFIIQ